MKINWKEGFFDKLGHSARLTAINVRKMEAVAARARASAPVETGEYRDRITVRVKRAAKRNVVLVVAEDPKSLIIESRTGNLARALNAEKNGG